MKLSIGIAALTVCMAAAVGCDSDHVYGIERLAESHAKQPARTWQDHVQDWPEPSKKAAKEMAGKYGLPSEMTSNHLVWERNGVWKRSVVTREPVHHEWPSPHDDVLEQFIDYRIPADKADDLAAFDGSVMFERTKGELSARCGGESANYLAINLAREIIEGTRTADDARRFYESAMKAPDGTDYTKKLRFQPALGGTQDPDTAAAQ